MRADYGYDVFGNRIEKVVDPDGAGPLNSLATRFAYDGLDLWADLDGNSNGLLTHYLRGDAIDELFARIDENDTTRWYLQDRLGSVTHLLNANGGVIDQIRYDSFGNILYESNPGVGDRFKFTGKERDTETGWQRHHFRYYISTLGVWSSEDPIRDGTNWRAYVEYGPTNAIDPDGLQQLPVRPGPMIRPGQGTPGPSTGFPPRSNPNNGGGGGRRGEPIDPGPNPATRYPATINPKDDPLGYAIDRMQERAAWARRVAWFKLRFPELTEDEIERILKTPIMSNGSGKEDPWEELARQAVRLKERGLWKSPCDNQDASPKPEPAAAGAGAGKGAGRGYRRTFFNAYPHLEGEVWVHHAIEQQVLLRYPGLFTEAEIHDLSNLRGIPLDINGSVHLSQIRKIWNEFYRTHPKATREEIIQQKNEIDRQFGHLFNPPVK
jgi:RHS repeat-associated protein